MQVCQRHPPASSHVPGCLVAVTLLQRTVSPRFTKLFVSCREKTVTASSPSEAGRAALGQWCTSRNLLIHRIYPVLHGVRESPTLLIPNPRARPCQVFNHLTVLLLHPGTSTLSYNLLYIHSPYTEREIESIPCRFQGRVIHSGVALCCLTRLLFFCLKVLSQRLVQILRSPSLLYKHPLFFLPLLRVRKHHLVQTSNSKEFIYCSSVK